MPGPCLCAQLKGVSALQYARIRYKNSCGADTVLPAEGVYENPRFNLNVTTKGGLSLLSTAACLCALGEQSLIIMSRSQQKLTVQPPFEAQPIYFLGLKSQCFCRVHFKAWERQSSGGPDLLKHHREHTLQLSRPVFDSEYAPGAGEWEGLAWLLLCLSLGGILEECYLISAASRYFCIF